MTATAPGTCHAPDRVRDGFLTDRTTDAPLDAVLDR